MQVTGLFNQELRIQCPNYGVALLDFYDKLHSNNALLPKYFCDGTHLNHLYLPFMEQALQTIQPE